jgi:hypothetical protein
MRKEFLDGYHARVLFYPDHSALQTLLVLTTRPVIDVTSQPDPVDAGPSVSSTTTEDDKFTGRSEIALPATLGRRSIIRLIATRPVADPARRR